MDEREIFGEGGGLPGSICDGPSGMIRDAALIPTDDPESYYFKKGDTVYRNYVADELKGKVVEVLRGRHDSQLIYVDWGKEEGVTLELSSWLRKDPTMVEHHDLWPTVASVVEQAFNPPKAVYENGYGLTVYSTRRGYVVLADRTYSPRDLRGLRELLANLPLEYYPEQAILSMGKDGVLVNEDESLKTEFASEMFEEKTEEDFGKLGTELASLASQMGYSEDHLGFLLKEMNFKEEDFIGDNRGVKVLEAMKKTSTGEPDQEYDHAFYDAICNELRKQGFNCYHKEFDKYQGVYIRVEGIDTFWGKEFFTSKDGGEVGFFTPEKSPEKEIGIVVKDGGADATELIDYCNEIRSTNFKEKSVEANKVKVLVEAGLESIRIHGSLASADREIYKLVKDTFGEAVADENTGVIADILKSQGLTASFTKVDPSRDAELLGRFYDLRKQEPELFKHPEPPQELIERYLDDYGPVEIDRVYKRLKRVADIHPEDIREDLTPADEPTPDEAELYLRQYVPYVHSPHTWDGVYKSINVAPYQKYLDKVPVMGIIVGEDWEHPIDDYSDWMPNGRVFIVQRPEGNYLVNTEGFPYARYVVKLIGWVMASKKVEKRTASRYSRYSSTDEQEESILALERSLEELGQKIIGGTTIGKSPQTVVLDVLKYQGSEVYVDPDGEVKIHDKVIDPSDLDSVGEALGLLIASKKIALGEVGKLAQQVYKWAVDKYGKEASYYINETHEIYDVLPDITGVSDEKILDKVFKTVKEIVKTASDDIDKDVEQVYQGVVDYKKAKEGEEKPHKPGSDYLLDVKQIVDEIIGLVDEEDYSVEEAVMIISHKYSTGPAFWNKESPMWKALEDAGYPVSPKSIRKKIRELREGSVKEGKYANLLRTAIQDGIPPNESPGWDKTRGDFDSYRTRGLDHKPTEKKDAERQTDPEVNNPFKDLDVPGVPEINEETLAKMEPGDRREMDNLLGATKDISTKISDSVKGLNENDQIPDTLKEDVNKLNEVVKSIEKLTEKYKTKDEEVKTQVDLVQE